MDNILGEKLVVFIEFNKEILRAYVLRMTVKDWLTNIRKKDNLICHSERSEESPAFIEFLIQCIKEYVKKWIIG